MGTAGSIARTGAAAWIALCLRVPAVAGAEAPVVRAAEALVGGRPHVALAESERLGRTVGERWRDEVALVAGLAAAGAGRAAAALVALDSVLASDPPSPYHALALAAALDLGRDPGTRPAARALAVRHLPRLVREPGRRRSLREESILGAFLRGGRITLELERELELTPDRSLPGTRCSGPAEAALYRAGMLALADGDAAGAGELLEALAAESPYFTYAQHGIARVRLALGDEVGAGAAFARLRATADGRGAEGPLRDRVSMLWAELSRRAGDADGAVRRLEGVDRAGAFAAAAALAGAAIRLDEGDPARALAHLATVAAASPRIEGRRALLEAEARIALRDAPGAVLALERGRTSLDAAIAALGGAATPERIASLRDRLVERAAGRPPRPWQSERLPAALAALADDDLAPSRFALRVAAWTASERDPLPPFVIPHPYDRFAVCGAGAAVRPADPLLAAVFRRLASPASERELAGLVHLRRAAEREDVRELALALDVRERRARETARREIARTEAVLDDRVRAALAAEAVDLGRLRVLLERSLADASVAAAEERRALLRTSGRTSGRRAPSPLR